MGTRLIPLARFTQQKAIAISSFILLLSFGCNANPNNKNILAEVNGVRIDSAMLSIVSSSREKGPLSGLEENQAELIDSLVSTELLYQQAKKTKLDQQERIALELELAHKTLLSQFYVMQFMDSIEIDEARLKAIYDQQAPKLMLRMVYWTFNDKQTADNFLKNKDLNNTSYQELPWQSLEELPFAHLTHANSITEGEWISEPVELDSSWSVWRCMESSSIPKPDFQDAKETIRQELATQALQEHLAALRKAAKIKVFEQVQP